MKFVQIIILFLFSFQSFSQTTLFSDAIQPNFPAPLVFVGDNLYVGTVQFESFIQRININDPNTATLITDFQSLFGVWKMVYYEPTNDLFVFTWQNTALHRVDLDSNLPVIPEFLVDIGDCGGMAIKDDVIFISAFNGAITAIYTYNISAGPSSFTAYYNEPPGADEMRNMVVYNNHLYFSQIESAGDINIYMIPLFDPNPQKTLVSTIDGIVGVDHSAKLVQDYMYIGIDSNVGHMILKLDLTSTLPIIPETVITNFPGEPIGLEFKNGLFYASEGNTFNIQNFQDPTLGLSEIPSIEDITVYPNPVSENVFISVNSGYFFDYSIYNVTGEKLLEGTYQKEGIRIAQLANGLYFMEINHDGNKVTKKFIKN